MTLPITTTFAGDSADARLQQYGLNIELLHAPLLLGYEAAASCTPHEPRSLPGTLVWGRAVGRLRDDLVPRGWRADSKANFETIVHPDNRHGIAVVAGTSQTGSGAGGAAPRTRTPKGPATSRAVRVNAQLSLEEMGVAVFPGTGVPLVADEDRETLLLLHYFDPDLGEIRCELSTPAEMGGKHITAWSQRIVLPPLPFDGELTFPIDIDDAPDIDIDVRRRQAD